MRLLTYFFAFFAMITSLLVLIYIFSNAMESMVQAVDYVVQNMTEKYNLTNVNLSIYDLRTALSPYMLGLNYALIIGFIAAVVGTVIYSRRR